MRKALAFRSRLGEIERAGNVLVLIKRGSTTKNIPMIVRHMPKLVKHRAIQYRISHRALLEYRLKTPLGLDKPVPVSNEALILSPIFKHHALWPLQHRPQFLSFKYDRRSCVLPNFCNVKKPAPDRLLLCLLSGGLPKRDNVGRARRQLCH